MKLPMMFSGILLATTAFAGPNDIIVKFDSPGSAMAARASATASLAPATLAPQRALPAIGAEVWRIEGAGALAAIGELASRPGYVYALPDRELEPAIIPNDPQFWVQWSHRWGDYPQPHPPCPSQDCDMDTDAAWDLATGNSATVVAIIDGGIDRNNAEIDQNMWTNAQEVSGVPGVDDDSNGFVDDEWGWDFSDNDNDPSPVPISGFSLYDHGSAIAGIIGAQGNDSTGIAGINWSVRMMSVKVFSNGGSGYASDLIGGLVYAADNGARVANVSLGYYGAPYQPLEDAVDYAGDRGVLVVCAAGNNAWDQDEWCTFWPAASENPAVVSVGATDQGDNRAWFSDWGATKVDLFAPGQNILSIKADPQYPYPHKYYLGTSFSAPQVVGGVALLLSREPYLTLTQVHAMVLSSGDALPQLNGLCATGRRLNIGSLLEEAPPSDDPPGGGDIEAARPSRDEVLTVPQAENRTDLYDIAGRKVKATKPGVYFHRPAVGPRRTVLVVP